MSLKARIEAVIYAAEEPVTLAQLAALFREEALASRAARHISANGTVAAQASIASEPGLAEAISAPQEEPPSELPEEPPPTPETGDSDSAAPVLATEPAAQNSADAEVATPDYAAEPQPVSAETAQESVEAAAAEAVDLSGPAPEPRSPEEEKRAARQRDREAREEVRRMIDELVAEYSASDRGLEIREVAGGFRFATRSEYHDAVRAFVKSLKPPMKLSLQALETLAVIAYKQPITAPEIAEIRGVDSGGVVGSLVARKLITTAGRKQVIGRPILYKTTREFLLRFGLRDLDELPSIEEFEKMAGELTEHEEETAEQPPLADGQAAGEEEPSAAEDKPGEVPATITPSPTEEPPPITDGDGNPEGQPQADPRAPIEAAEPSIAEAASEQVSGEEEHSETPSAADGQE